MKQISNEGKEFDEEDFRVFPSEEPEAKAFPKKFFETACNANEFETNFDFLTEIPVNRALASHQSEGYVG